MRRSVLGMTTALAIVATLTLVGCGGGGTGDGGATAIVAGGRSNMPAPRLIGEARDWIEAAVENRHTVVIVGVSGRPRTLHRERVETRCDSDRACAAFRNDYIAKLNGLLTKVKADSEEADTLGAILEAARQLENVTGPKHVIVIDSGMQTTGHLRMQAPGAFGVDPEEVAKHIGSDGRLQSLQGVRMLLTGIGSSAEPQPQVAGERVSKLEQLWEKILTRAGAEVEIDHTDLKGQAIADLPKVAVVRDDPPAPISRTGCVRLREDQVGFLANKATLRDPAKAKEVLTPIAAELNQKKVAATVTGTTALAEDPPYPLSVARAKTVVDILVEQLGVDRASLTPVGVGINFQGYLPPYNSDGGFNETLAVQNRLVIVQPAGSSCPA